MVRLEDVELVYGGGAGAALRGVSFSVAGGEFRWLLGASGAGKSSLLRLLHVAVLPTAGRLNILGRDIPAGGRRGLRRGLPLLRRRIGMIFQDFRLLPHLTALQNVAVPLRLAGRPQAEWRADAEEMLAWVGLASRRDAYPSQLSGGEQQRVAIARAVVTRPSLLLADEPTGNLDEAQAGRLMRLLHEMNRLGATVIVATHNEALVDRHPAPTLRLDRGRLVLDG